ncbi:MAG TPA: PhzF family phenazine biosynthesis protein, partial [Solirubrobacteraceae bacterium]|nr:PhzF family phenazine biosynthesis protein [Solirubrobacteraceae bacterium]
MTGNQLAVVHDADGIDDETMQAFARETRQSETTFVQSSDSGADYRCRIWMTRHELPFAGHPSLGTAVAVALARGDTKASYVQETRAGLQPIDVEVVDERRARTSMLQEPATFGPELAPEEVLRAAGVDAAHAHPELPVQVVHTGVPQILAPVRPEALRDLRPDFPLLEALIVEHDAATLYLAAIDGDRVRARSLYVDPQAVSEDP